MRSIEKELALIKQLQYEHFFLTVHEIVQWARGRPKPILCQGRGSAANSVVCYALRITEVDPAQHRRVVRALHQRGAQRAAGHRRRLRARATRGSHPARVREVRARARGAGRDRHHLSAKERDPRRRQGAGARRRRDRSPRESAGVLGRLGNFPQQHRQPGTASGCGRHPAAVRTGEGAAEFPAASVAARRRLRDRAGTGQRAGADRERGDARAPGHSVGQERPGVARPAQGRRARARHADGPAADVRSAGDGRHRPDEHGADPARGSGDLRHDLPRRYDRRVPDRVARADEHVAAAAGRATTTTW